MSKLKIYRGVLCNDTEEWWKIWRVIWIDLPQNWQKKFDKFWLENLKVSKTYTLTGCFWPKYWMFQLKKYSKVIFHNTREWCKFWRKTNLWFRKWHQEFGKLWPEETKVSKLGLLLGPFIQSRKCMSLKFTRELCVKIMKNDAKFEKEVTCQFKIYMRNLTNFDLNTQKSQKFAL